MPANLDFLRLADRVADSVADYAGFDACQRDEIAVSVVEACTNAIQHGCGSDENKRIRVSFIVEEDGLKVQVLDKGSGFSPEGVECRMEKTEEPRGRGIGIIRTYMDEVLFDFNEGTLVTMVKRRKTA
ncbi:MAG: ATP-binding protein [Candidatus Eisenbacteria bacterium]